MTFCTAAWPGVSYCSIVYHPDTQAVMIKHLIYLRCKANPSDTSKEFHTVTSAISQTIFFEQNNMPEIKSMTTNNHNLTWDWEDTTLGYELEGESSKHSLFSLKVTFLMIVHLLIWSCKDCTHEYTFSVIDVVLIYTHFHFIYLGILSK